MHVFIMVNVAIDKDIKQVYSCYLGKDLGVRTGAIVDFVAKEDGRTWFIKYSTNQDSVLDFIKRCDAAGLLLEKM